jgi:peptidoglycan/LPS O-acetylase OafA/YrhL
MWFLWFLCWLVPIFALFAWAADRFGWPRLSSGFVLSPLRFLWLVPLTMIPQYLMGLDAPTFGPDTSAGLLPKPHLLLYYGLFFGFGALYFDAGDDEGRLGRWWWLILPLSLCLALPLGLNSEQNRSVTGLAQVVYAWSMCVGLMGLFRRYLSQPSAPIRYMSDASYWLYLTHLPLLLAAQVIVRDWSLPATLKFVIICTVVTAVLLVAYQTMVRYTWIGRMLNGPRKRGSVLDQPALNA